MDKELEKYYENQFDLFSKQGWKGFVNKAEELFDHYNDLESTSEELVKFRKGQLDILRWITSWENSVEETYENLKNG